MNRLKKKAIILSIAGFIAGILIGIIISLLTASSEETPTNLWSRLFYLLVGGIHGAIAMGSSIIYEKEDWSIAGVTITHFVITLASFYTLGTIQGWLNFGDAVFWIITIVFIVVYIIIWLANYLAYKRAVKEMNNDLEKIQGKK